MTAPSVDPALPVQEVAGRTLDWRPRFDERSRAFRFGAAQLPGRSRLWAPGPDVLDQGQEGACVGFSCAGEAAASPARVKGITDADALAIYRRAQRLDDWPGECVDQDTQCLTRTGWKSGDELAVGDEILTFDLETESTRWAVVENVHRYEAKRYRVWSQRGFAAAVTDNHRWPVRTRDGGSGFPRPFRMTTTAEWRVGDEFLRAAPCGDLPTEAKWDDDLVEMVAWVITEGSYRPDHRRGTGITVAQKVYHDRVAALMARMGVAPGSCSAIGCHTWEISGPLSRQLREIAPARAPRVDWLASLTQRQLRLFLDVCTMADGCTTPAEGSRKSRDVFAQKPGPILDAWLIAAVLAGQPVSRARGGACETWTLRGSDSIATRKLIPSDYITGPVWCPETEVGTFVARRGTSLFITGNSYSGTSVLAGCLAGRERGLWGGFRWAMSAEELAAAVVALGPAIIGIEWREGSYDTDALGVLRPSGPVVGGHALCVLGYIDPARVTDYMRRRLTRLGLWPGVQSVGGPVFVALNSWGPTYGKNGLFLVPLAVMRSWVAARGEFAIPQARSYGGAK